MNCKPSLKIALDFTMIIIYLLLLNPFDTGLVFHEFAGVLAITLFGQTSSDTTIDQGQEYNNNNSNNSNNDSYSIPNSQEENHRNSDQFNDRTFQSHRHRGFHGTGFRA